MDLMSRSSGSPAAQHQTVAAGHGRKNTTSSMSYMFLVLAASLAILLSAVALFVANNNNGSGGESKYLNSKEYQAIFLNNGQVYFGKVQTLNTKVVVIDDVFYIEAQSGTSQTTTTNNNYTLRKLGTSELHAPEDRMVINRDQVTFWENIKDTGQVVTKIKEYKANPNAANQVQSNSSTNSSTQTTPTATQNSTTKKAGQ